MGNRWFHTSIAIFGVAALVLLATSAFSSSPAVERLSINEGAPAERIGVHLSFREFEAPVPAALVPQETSPRGRLEVPQELPGADAPALQFPQPDPSKPHALEDAVKKLYPPLPPLGENLYPEMAADGKSVTLADLQRLAQAHNPALRQAAASIEIARGGIVQAGVYPNPVVGFEADSVNQSHTSGMVGGYVNQEIVLLTKIRLARAVAESDRDLAQQMYCLLEAEILAGVRAGYFAVLAAQEVMRVQAVLTNFTDELYRVQVDLVKNGKAAPYEPLQLRVLAFQSRGQLVQARNRYSAAWKQLASVVGQPEMPLLLLAGALDQPLPLLRHEVLQSMILARHSDVRSAQLGIEKAQRALRLAELNRVPNVTVATTLQRDFTTGLGNTIYSLQVGMPVPVFNRNQGNILKARGELEKAGAEVARVRNDLTSKLAEAYERYDNQRRIIVYYRDHILPDQVRAYRGVYGRYQQDPEHFTDIVTAQQLLVGVTTAYLQSLRDAWTAVVDLGKLAQSPELTALSDELCETRPACAGGTCAAGWLGNVLTWPAVMPVEPKSGPRESRITVPPALPSLVPCAPREADSTAVRVLPQPVGEPVLLPTVGPVERSTKRRKFFGLPMRRPDVEPTPIVLPPAEEVRPCFRPEVLAPAPSTPPPNLMPPLQKCGSSSPLDEKAPRKGESPSASADRLPVILEGPLPGRKSELPSADAESGPKESGSNARPSSPPMGGVRLPPLRIRRLD